MQESSVAFNLAQLMRLEEQRVQAEIDREARELVTNRARQEVEELRARDAQRARLLAERTEQAGVLRELGEREHARQVELLRLRLELEAAERIERERLDRAHALEVERLRRPERQARVARWAAGVLAAALAGCAAFYLGVLEPALRSARTLATEAAALAAERAQALEQLRTSTLALREAEAVAPVVAGPTAVNVAPAGVQFATPRVRTAATAGSSREAGRPTGVSVRPATDQTDGLEDLDLDSNDPLKDLTDGRESHRRPRKR